MEDPKKDPAAAPAAAATDAKKGAGKGQAKRMRRLNTMQRAEKAAKDKSKGQPTEDDNEEEQVVVKAEPKTAKEKALNLMETRVYVVSMIIVTVLALFLTDMWESCGPPPKSSDVVIHATMLVCFFFFTAEIIVLSWARVDYLFSFFFWLDCIASLSLLPEALMLFEADILALLGDSSTSLSLTRAGRAARAGTRAVRVMQVMKSEWDKYVAARAGVKKKGPQEESQIGGRLAAGITEKVILVVTVMLVSTLVITGSVGTKTDASFVTILSNLEDLYLRCGGSRLHRGCTPVIDNCRLDSPNVLHPTCQFNLYLQQTITMNNGKMGCSSVDQGLIGEALDAAHHEALECRMRVFNNTYNFRTYETSLDCSKQVVRSLSLLGGDLFCGQEYEHLLRDTELIQVTLESGSRISFDDVLNARGVSVSNILQVIFIILLLGLSSYFFHLDAERLVIGPISKMAKLVDKLNKNPLAPIEENHSNEFEEFETGFVERALRKFGKLIQIAFGEAGADVLGKDNISADGLTSTFVAGRKMQAIFGFAIVRNFNTCTECLQEDVMLFVNTIADIVHRACHDNQGAPNKNIGDSFLLVWRLDDEADITKPVGTIADDAVKSFVRACMEVQASEVLRKMTENPRIQEAMPGYRVTMGFGLHVGWGIEGAIGSMLKIDASYLSPNVNLAARLESGTHQFHVDILLSDAVFNMLSPYVQSLHRKIDCVTMKGSQLPITIYTYDVPYFGAKTIDELYQAEDPELDFWDNYPPRTSSTFRKRHAEGVRLYLEGNWSEARKLLETCLQENSDGPSRVLLDVMAAKKFISPDGWKGFRELTNK